MDSDPYFADTKEKLAKSRTLLEEAVKELNRIHERLNSYRKLNENAKEFAKRAVKDEADETGIRQPRGALG